MERLRGIVYLLTHLIPVYLYPLVTNVVLGVLSSKGHHLLRLSSERITIPHDARPTIGAISAMTSRRAIILVFMLGVTFLMAHTINAVIAEALFLPSGVALPRAVDQDGSATRSPSALAEHVRMSGLFPLPPDPVNLTEGGMPVGPGGI